MAAFVNIPCTDSEFWEPIGRFETRGKVIAFVKEKFGADAQGRICLVSEVDDEIEDKDDDELEAEAMPRVESDAR